MSNGGNCYNELTGSGIQYSTEPLSSNYFNGNISFVANNDKSGIYLLKSGQTLVESGSKVITARLHWLDIANPLHRPYIYGGGDFLEDYSGNSSTPESQIRADLIDYLSANDYPSKYRASALLSFAAPNFTIYETNHGKSTGIVGKYNFYHATYPFGNFSNSWGDFLSISEYSEGGSHVQIACRDLSKTDKRELYGTPTVPYTLSALPYYANTPSKHISLSPLFDPYIECPEVPPNPYRFSEIEFDLIGGTSSGGQGGNYYNNNIIPSSLDYIQKVLTSRYKVNDDGIITGLPDDYINRSGIEQGDVGLDNKLNSAVCKSLSMETRIYPERKGLENVTEYTPISSPFQGGSEYPSFESWSPWNEWHFTFKGNEKFLPYEAGSMGSFRQSTTFGTLMDGINGDSDYWWENRQCPEVVDFLPWTYGATIYDCPKDYMDIPYHSAVGKYGFYGVRFFNTCKAPYRRYNSTGESGSFIEIDEIDVTDVGQNYELGEYDDSYAGYGDYDELIASAKLEELANNLNLTDPVGFLYRNYTGGSLTASSEWKDLTGYNDKFYDAFTGLITGFSDVVEVFDIQSGNDHLDSVLSQHFYNDRYSLLTDIKYNNQEKYKEFLEKIQLSPRDSTYEDAFSGFLAKFSNYIALNSNGNIDQNYYTNQIQKLKNRIATKASLSFTYGKPVDLYPLNTIYYSFDEVTGYKGTGWAHRNYGPSVNESNLPEIQRRYFYGTYGSATNALNKLQHISGKSAAFYKDNFYIGTILNKDCVVDDYKIRYYGANGIGFYPTTNIPINSAVQTTGNFLAGMLGYNEIGELTDGYTCYSPIFVQNPKDVFAKLGQSPTFRALAVDYHTLPEDKINKGYSEIDYWAEKLKILKTNGSYKYPMKYKWGRIPIGSAQQITSGDYFTNDVQWASADGEWCCLEGGSDQDSENCTFIHPAQCNPPFTESYNKFSQNYKWLQGIKSDDENYLYFCLASGRFGIRSSDHFRLRAEKAIYFDISIMNGGNVALNAANITFKSLDLGSGVTATPIDGNRIDSYYGIVQDKYVIPEEKVKVNRYVRAGQSNLLSYGEYGNYYYRGGLRSWTPQYFTDSKGLRVRWGAPIEYGWLQKYKIELDDEKGRLLYGVNHLPVYAGNGLFRGGLQINVNIDTSSQQFSAVTNATNYSYLQGIINLNDTIGLLGKNLTSYGQLFMPPNFNLGYGNMDQFHQNLGIIHSPLESQSDYDFIIGSDQNTGDMWRKTQSKLNLTTGSSLVAGDRENIWVEATLSRNMSYFVEASARFYTYCNSKAKYNVPNHAFVAPGLRYGDPGFQYSWLGKPHDMYLTRKSMYGPYAYQWKVNRHNRDRMGNGISEGFYSYIYEDKYPMMYDNPAIYGLYGRHSSITPINANSIDYINNVRAYTMPNTWGLQGQTIGVMSNREDGYGWGEIRQEGYTTPCAPERINGNSAGDAVNIMRNLAHAGDWASYEVTGEQFPTVRYCHYLEELKNFSFDASTYNCNSKDEKDGFCFHPCLSIGYSLGMTPGGKSLNFFDRNQVNGKTILKRLTSLKSQSYKEYEFKDSETEFLGPENSYYSNKYADEYPYVTGVWPDNLERSEEISPCTPGATDHCNYNTAVLNIGALQGFVNGYSNFAKMVVPPLLSSSAY